MADLLVVHSAESKVEKSAGWLAEEKVEQRAVL